MIAHLQGKKYSARHTSVIDAVLPVAKAAAKLDCVTKIVLGLIKQIRGQAVLKRLKIVQIEAGLLVTVRGSKTMQEIYIYTHDRAQTIQVITQAFLP